MRKDVIYIDVEDDITAILSKVKASTADIVALVPPKRIGALQSVVNLKLLQNGAQDAGKRVVLVSSDHLLMSLASRLKMPVAKNLQSKPEIPTMDALPPETDDQVNGEELPVGELASLQEARDKNASLADEISNKVDLSDEAGASGTAAAEVMQPDPATPKSKLPISKAKIPDFNKFRKRLLIGGAVLILLVGFLYWATIIAPRAVITVSAATTPVPINQDLTLQPTLASSSSTNLQLKPVIQQLKNTQSVSFTATGSKDIGSAATGTITVRNCDYPNGFTLAQNTQFVGDNGLQFLSDQEASVPAFSGPASACQLDGNSAGKADVTVHAAAIGPDYNVGSQNYTITGLTGHVDAVGSAMAGGSRQTVTVVAQSDIDKAKAQLTQQITQSEASLKAKLIQQFSNDQIAILESYTTSGGNPTSNPDLNQQAQSATLSIETTYTMWGLERSDVKQVLAKPLNDALSGKPGQSVFDDGSNSIQFQSFQPLGDGSATVVLATTGHIGTTMNSTQIANEVKGKLYGEANQIINQIPGVTKVDIKLSPFWVTSVPNDLRKVSIKFTVVNGNG